MTALLIVAIIGLGIVLASFALAVVGAPEGLILIIPGVLMMILGFVFYMTIRDEHRECREAKAFYSQPTEIKGFHCAILIHGVWVDYGDYRRDHATP